MSIRHHAPAPYILDYASGALVGAPSLIIAAHVALCPKCRAEVEALEQIGGVLMESAPAAELSDDLLNRTMALLDAPGDEPRKGALRKENEKRCAAPRPSRLREETTAPDPVLPDPIRRVVGGGLEAVRWRGLGPGVRQALLSLGEAEEVGAAKARLLRVAPGVALPHHSHEGAELSLVLQGAFRDGAERYARGDLQVADEAVGHAPIAEAGEDCICLVVTEAPLKFKGIGPRLLQGIFRI